MLGDIPGRQYPIMSGTTFTHGFIFSRVGMYSTPLPWRSPNCTLTRISHEESSVISYGGRPRLVPRRRIPLRLKNASDQSSLLPAPTTSVVLVEWDLQEDSARDQHVVYKYLISMHGILPS